MCKRHQVNDMHAFYCR